MGKDIYTKSSKSERQGFLASCSYVMSAALTKISLTLRDFRIDDLKVTESNNLQTWEFKLKGQSREIPFRLKVRKIIVENSKLLILLLTILI